MDQKAEALKKTTTKKLNMAGAHPSYTDAIRLERVNLSRYHNELFYLTEGSLLSAMADAVEKCDTFLMCVSDKYQESSNCKLGKNTMFTIFTMFTILAQ